jgi:hypothetical protein
MGSSIDKQPFSVSEVSPGQEVRDSSRPEESKEPVRTDRLYQVAALAAGIILLATFF